MENQVLEDLLKQTEQLSPADRLLLAARLIENVRREIPSKPSGIKWRDVRGMLPYPAFGEDAQAYISRTRREDTEHRERQIKRKE